MIFETINVHGWELAIRRLQLLKSSQMYWGTCNEFKNNCISACAGPKSAHVNNKRNGLRNTYPLAKTSVRWQALALQKTKQLHTHHFLFALRHVRKGIELVNIPCTCLEHGTTYSWLLKRNHCTLVCILMIAEKTHLPLHADMENSFHSHTNTPGCPWPASVDRQALLALNPWLRASSSWALHCEVQRAHHRVLWLVARSWGQAPDLAPFWAS